VGAVVSGTYWEFLAAIAGSTATLTGLLFVAMTVTGRRSASPRPAVIEQVRAAASIVVFTNALAVSLFGLVPGNNIGYPATVLAVIGIFYTAAGARSIFSSHPPRRRALRQFELIALLLAVFAFELVGGIRLILDPRNLGAAGLVCDLLVVLLLIGIARAWELVGDRDTGPLASIAVLAGHDRDPAGLSIAHAARPDLDDRPAVGEAGDGDIPDRPGVLVAQDRTRTRQASTSPGRAARVGAGPSPGDDDRSNGNG
jgi:hypothetical protein